LYQMMLSRAMKIFVCGKGGSGKSSIAALMAKMMAERGHRVLVVDTDESNYGLHRHLGLELPPDLLKFFDGKKGLFQRMRDDKTLFPSGWSMDDIPADYLSKKDGISLLAIGKIHEFGEGCACPMGSLARQLLESLTLGPGEIVIVDTEAGIEHLGRGVEKGSDIILVVLDPSFESIALSKKIVEMGEGLGKPVYLFLNKADGDVQGVMLKDLDSSRLVGILPFDPGLFQAGLRGEEIKVVPSGLERLAGILEGN